MSLNQIRSYDQKRVKRLGKYYASIDFNVNESISVDNYRDRRDKVNAGELSIGGKSYDMNIGELIHLRNTIDRALEVVDKKYRTRLM